MAGVASQLGYNEQSSFNRACRRWFGSAPNAFKARRSSIGGPIIRV
jgi:AraC-like DNA-binding protein